MSRHKPTAIKLRRQTQQLDISFSNGDHFTLPAEYLRVYSPSAEVRGHGRDQEVLQYGKSQVAISSLNQVGNYALQLHFSDGHNSGIYSWDYLFDLGQHYQQYWHDYLDRLHRAGLSRDSQVQIIKL